MIIAVDFDGILCEDAFPEIGTPNYEMISFVRQLMDGGHEVILWTSRTGERLVEAVDWCGNRGLHFCAVNANAPSNLAQYQAEYPTPSPKVYADLYLEDRDPWFVRYGQTRCRSDKDTMEVLIDHTRKSINKLEHERRMREEREMRKKIEEQEMRKKIKEEEGASDD